jgi:hypothetical protein
MTEIVEGSIWAKAIEPSLGIGTLGWAVAAAFGCAVFIIVARWPRLEARMSLGGALLAFLIALVLASAGSPAAVLGVFAACAAALVRFSPRL